MSERKSCARCSKEIVGRGLCVEGDYFHPDCFWCDKCKSPLSGKFHKQDGQRICEGCKSYPYCESCRKKIEGKETRSEGRVWHPECFRCSQCQQPIVGTFCRIEGALTCSKCRDAAAPKAAEPTEPKELPICRGCKKPVQEDESRILADKRDMFHEACFKCTTCAKPLHSYVILQRKFSYQDCPYFCDSCAAAHRAAEEADRDAQEAAAAARAARCAACDQPCGEDAFQLLDGRVLHVSCFKCSSCSESPLPDSQGTLQLPLLRSKVDALLRGEYFCSKCAPQTTAPKGYPKEAKAASKESETAKVEEHKAPEVPPAPAVVSDFMTLEELRSPEIWKARGVEASSREQLLSDADFQTAFGVTKEDFAKLAGWKKSQKKRELGLF